MNKYEYNIEDYTEEYIETILEIADFWGLCALTEEQQCILAQYNEGGCTI